MIENINCAVRFVLSNSIKTIICEIFNIDSKHNEMYINVINDTCSVDDDMLEGLILNLACNIPKCEPYKTRRICQIRAYSYRLKKLDT